MPAAASSAIEERRRYGLDVSKTRTGNLSIENEQRFQSAVIEDAAETQQDEEYHQKLQGLSEMRKVKLAEAAMERASTKLSMVGID